MHRRQYEISTLSIEQLLCEESLFHCANGYLGVRGCYEEGYPAGYPSIRGCYVNGFYDDGEIEYDERLHGFPQTKQTMVNLPDAQSITLELNGRAFSMFDAQVRDYSRTLDMDAGITSRELTYLTESGSVRIRIRRMASFADPSLFIIDYTIESLDYTGEITLVSGVRGDVRNHIKQDDPRVSSGDGKRLSVEYCTLSNGVMELGVKPVHNELRLACAVMHVPNRLAPVSALCEAESTAETFSGFLAPGEQASLIKYCIYVDTRRAENPRESARTQLIQDCAAGVLYWYARQKELLADFWRTAYVQIDNDDTYLQTAIDLSAYNLLCAAGGDDASSVAAKGLSGEGYEGHYFWDAETYIFPFLLLTDPRRAKSLLCYRYGILDAARKNARKLGHERGALYAWRTISGSECSSYFPSGTAQYHINADIAHAFIQYWLCTQDESFLQQTAEVLLETARLWLDTGHWRNNDFCIDCVTGPDEYTCMVNNNYYTNAGAKENLTYAARLCRLLPDRAGASVEELNAFENAAAHMLLPVDKKLNICMQDDSFLNKKRWEIASIPKENFPLLLHYHPLTINRCQILKQADTLMSFFQFGEESALRMQTTYDYYEPITTHDSSLSCCIHSIMAARLGDTEKAYTYFLESADIDLANTSGNTGDGLHLANMGGTYLAVVAGFAGLRIRENGLFLFPLLPDKWNRATFCVRYKGRIISVSFDKYSATLSLKGAPLTVSVYGQDRALSEIPQRFKRPLNGVLFDLDGVVTNTAVYHYRAWQRIAGELGVHFDEAFNERFKGVSRAECLDMLLETGSIHMSAEEKQCVLVRKNEYYLAYLGTLSRADILPGILDSLSLLSSHNVKTALFSVSKNTDTILARLELSDVFDTVVTGFDIEHSKPAPEGYLLAAERLGIDARLCAMIEDSSAGIAGARRLSMRTIGIGNGLHADVSLQNTGELPAVLATLLSEE